MAKPQDGQGPPGGKGPGEGKGQRLIEKEMAEIGSVSKLLSLLYVGLHMLVYMGCYSLRCLEVPAIPLDMGHFGGYTLSTQRLLSMPVMYARLQV